MRSSLLLALALTVAPAFAQSDLATPGTAAPSLNVGPVVAQQGRIELYSNGPLINGAGTGAGGADESILQNVTIAGVTAYGSSANVTADSQWIVADDFTVPAGETWTLTEVVLYGYQTNSTTASTFKGANPVIYDRSPDDPAAVVLAGDITTSSLDLSVWSNAYRVAETSTTCQSGSCTARPIMANTAILTPTLTGGTYWLGWTYSGTLSSGPWQPEVATQGVCTPDANALQYNPTTAVWAAATNGPCAVAYPFLINGTRTTSSAGDDPRLDGLQLSVRGSNPARGTAMMTLRVDDTQVVSVEAFDRMGRRVAVLHEGAVAAGTLPLVLDAQALPAGLYVVRATGASASATVRVTTVR